jgi:hypothetical protein
MPPYFELVFKIRTNLEQLFEANSSFRPRHSDCLLFSKKLPHGFIYTVHSLFLEIPRYAGTESTTLWKVLTQQYLLVCATV